MPRPQGEPVRGTPGARARPQLERCAPCQGLPAGDLAGQHLLRAHRERLAEKRVQPAPDCPARRVVGRSLRAVSRSCQPRGAPLLHHVANLDQQPTGQPGEHRRRSRPARKGAGQGDSLDRTVRSRRGLGPGAAGASPSGRGLAGAPFRGEARHRDARAARLRGRRRARDAKRLRPRQEDVAGAVPWSCC